MCGYYHFYNEYTWMDNLYDWIIMDHGYNKFLPYDFIFTKDKLLDFIWKDISETNDQNIKDYGQAISILNNIYNQMGDNRLVYFKYCID